MAKNSEYVCNNCGHVSSKWSGKCDACGAWNTMTEEPSGDRPPIGRSANAPKGRKVELSSLSGRDTDPARLISGISELDRVLGGGLVAGSATLLGGDPGIGKSTLLLQAAASMARKELRTVYVSGEEALAQMRMRAVRLKLAQAPVELAAETNICLLYTSPSPRDSR